MSEQGTSRAGQIAVVLAVIAAVLALSAALIKYLRFGEIDIATIAAGIAIPAIVISLVKSRGSKRQ
ncbi:MAG TPA: hypothetical protein VGC66_09300 [Pyrinomonadaceae bacterium]|jgi:hypothetical protein